MLCGKISKSLYIINRVKNFLPKDSMLSLYYSLIHSNLSYCASIYGCATKTTLTKLFIKQKQAVRIINKSNYRDHTAPIFKTLKILPLEQLISYCQLKFMHNFSQNNIPPSFYNMWIKNRDRNPNLALRNADDIYIQPHRYESLKRMPLFNFPRIWNAEGEIKREPNCDLYLRSLKHNLPNSLI